MILYVMKSSLWLLCFGRNVVCGQRVRIDRQLDESASEHDRCRRLHGGGGEMSTRRSAAGQHGRRLHVSRRRLESIPSAIVPRSV